MKFVDLETQQEVIRDELRARIDAVLAHGKYIMGPEVFELEEKLASIAGTRYAIGCASGTDGLLMALMALEVGPGDLVLTTPFTFVSTAEVIKLLGAEPVFVDIREDTFNIDPEKIQPALNQLDKAQRERVKGLIAVDLFGLPADYDAIRAALDDRHFIIEDAAQSFGASHKSRPAGSLADIAVTSFFPAKPLGCYGDGGALFTDNDRLAEVLHSIRIHGKGGSKYENVRIGVNGRLDTLQAAILLAKLTVFDRELAARRATAARYNEELQGHVRTPVVPSGSISVWANYSILCDQRDELLRSLADADIPTAIYYPKPLHCQEAFIGNAVTHDCPMAEAASKNILSIPVHPYMRDEDIGLVIDTIRTTGLPSVSQGQSSY